MVRKGSLPTPTIKKVDVLILALDLKKLDMIARASGYESKAFLIGKILEDYIDEIERGN